MYVSDQKRRRNAAAASSIGRDGGGCRRPPSSSSSSLLLLLCRTCRLLLLPDLLVLSCLAVLLSPFERHCVRRGTGQRYRTGLRVQVALSLHNLNFVKRLRFPPAKPIPVYNLRIFKFLVSTIYTFGQVPHMFCMGGRSRGLRPSGFRVSCLSLAVHSGQLPC